MAFMKDRKPPINLFQEGRPTRKALDKQASVTDVVETANNMLVKPAAAPFVNSGKTVVNAANNVFNPVAKQNNKFGGPDAEMNRVAGPQPAMKKQPFMNGVQQDTAAPMMNKRNRDADAMLYGDSAKVVGGNSPEAAAVNSVAEGQNTGDQVASPFVNSQRPIQPGNGMTVNLSDRDKQIKSNIGQIDSMLASGTEATPEQMQRINKIKQDAGFMRGGTDRRPVGPDGRPIQASPFNRGVNRVGNMDVTFDQSVSPQQRQSFLEQPVRPTAQIDRFNARQDNTPFVAMNASRNAERIIGRKSPFKAQNGELFTPENSPEMGHKQRRALNMQILQNQQADRNNEAALAREQAGNATSRMNTQDTVTQRMAEASMNNRAATDQNEINRSRVESQNALTGFELEQKKYVDALQKQYAATTDPQQRKILERQLYALGLKQPPKVQIATERDVNADGYPVTKNYIIDETGNTRPMVGGQDPTSMFADRPADAKDYIVGKIYKNKDGGAAIWTGEGFLTVNY